MVMAINRPPTVRDLVFGVSKPPKTFRFRRLCRAVFYLCFRSEQRCHVPKRVREIFILVVVCVVDSIRPLLINHITDDISHH
jgi:hypothetical protein